MLTVYRPLLYYYNYIFTGSLTPVPSFPSDLPCFQPIFDNILNPLLLAATGLEHSVSLRKTRVFSKKYLLVNRRLVSFLIFVVTPDELPTVLRSIRIPGREISWIIRVVVFDAEFFP